MERVGDADDELKALDAALDRNSAPRPPPPSLTAANCRPPNWRAPCSATASGRIRRHPNPHAPRVGLSDDPDARPETLVHDIDLTKAVALIRDSLSRGEAVVWGSTDNHALLIYGADYDATGRRWRIG